MKQLRLAFLTLLFYSVNYSIPSWADALDDIMRSPVLSDRRAVDANSENVRWDDPRWFEGKPNLRKLFINTYDEKGPMYLLQWLGELATADYTLKYKKGSVLDSHVALQLTYAAPQNAAVTIDILVPHPLKLDQVEMKLLPDFAKFEPPRLMVESLEKMEIRNFPAVFYQHKNGGCSLLFKIAGYTHVNFYTERCSDSKHLIALAEQCELTRLNYKLEN